jgi:hypothetical protein
MSNYYWAELSVSELPNDKVQRVDFDDSLRYSSFLTVITDQNLTYDVLVYFPLLSNRLILFISI